MTHIIWVLWYDSWNELWWRKIRFQCSKISWRFLFSVWKISIRSFESSFPVRHGTSGVFSGIGVASGFDCWLLSRFIHWFENILSFCVTIVIRCEPVAFRFSKCVLICWCESQSEIKKDHRNLVIKSHEPARKPTLGIRSFDKNCILDRPAFSGFPQRPPDNFTHVRINKIEHFRG